MPNESDYLPAINRLVADIERRDAETAEMKRDVNRLCGYAKIPIKYPNAEGANGAASPGTTTAIRPGQFYRKPLATAVSAFLGMRGDPNNGGTGPATLDEIYAALTEGGFEFDAQSPSTAKRALSISLAKNSQTFERLPTKQIGMRSWYRRESD